MWSKLTIKNIDRSFPRVCISHIDSVEYVQCDILTDEDVLRHHLKNATAVIVACSEAFPKPPEDEDDMTQEEVDRVRGLIQINDVQILEAVARACEDAGAKNLFYVHDCDNEIVQAVARTLLDSHSCLIVKKMYTCGFLWGPLMSPELVMYMKRVRERHTEIPYMSFSRCLKMICPQPMFVKNFTQVIVRDVFGVIGDIPQAIMMHQNLMYNETVGFPSFLTFVNLPLKCEAGPTNHSILMSKMTNVPRKSRPEELPVEKRLLDFPTTHGLIDLFKKDGTWFECDTHCFMCKFVCENKLTDTQKYMDRIIDGDCLLDRRVVAHVDKN